MDFALTWTSSLSRTGYRLADGLHREIRYCGTVTLRHRCALTVCQREEEQQPVLGPAETGCISSGYILGRF